MSGWLLPGVQHLQNPHPLVVHFPVAFLYGAALLYFLAWIRRSETVGWTALWVLGLGALGAGASVATGYYANGGVMVAESVRAALLEHHKHWMVATSIVAGGLTAWALLARPMPARGRVVFLAGLVAMLAILTTGADYGGRLVYDYNAGGDACGQPIEFTR